MRNAVIIGTGVYVPEKILTNDDLSRILGESINDFVENKVGIVERHIAGDAESAADLATEAAKNALEKANLKADAIDLIILATDTPEYISPATSVVVQKRIGATNAGTFDINSACAGFVTALDAAFKYIIADKYYKNVLVVGCYAMSKFLDWTDKKTMTLFADGAGAVILQATENDEAENGFLASKLFANGDYAEFMGIFAGGTKMPIDEKVLADRFIKRQKRRARAARKSFEGKSFDKSGVYFRRRQKLSGRACDFKSNRSRSVCAIKRNRV